MDISCISKTGLRALVLVPLLLVGCGSPPPTTVDELALVLQEAGLSYDNAEPLSFKAMKHARIDEGVALLGEGLRVELIRIDDPRTYRIFRSLGPLLTIVEQAADVELPGKPQLYSSAPFIVVIREEPVEGMVLDILNKVLPEQDPV